MANLAESSIWETGVYQIEENDPVHGGANGITNRPAKQLANRTVWLKNELASSVQAINANLASLSTNKADKTLNLVAGNGLTGGGTLQANRTLTLGTPSQITASTTNSVTATSHTHAIDKASTTTQGIVQLVDNLTTDDATKALTASQGKALHDNKLDKTANAVSASRLATARNIALTGAVTGNVNFDGSDNVSIATTLNLADFANSKTENGYQKLPNGLIIQWGEYIVTSYPSQPSVSIAFPIAFPYKCLHVFTTRHMARHSDHGDGGALVISKSTTGAEISVQNFSVNYADLRGFSWLAIGY